MKRKRLEIEYTLVDEYLKQATLKKLRAIKEPKPLLPKVNVTKSRRKSDPLLCGSHVRGN